MRVNKVAYDLSCFDNLEGGYLSFDISDSTTVVAAIHSRYGVPQKNSQNIMWRDLEFGGCKFTSDEEFDDVFIMTGSERGIEVLKPIYLDLTSSSAPRA